MTKKRNTLGNKREVRPGVWKIRVSDGYNADGTQRRVHRTIHGTERDADIAIHEIYAEITENPTAYSGYTLGEYFERRFIPERVGTVTKKTLEFHQSMWKHVPEKWKRDELKEQPHAAVQRWVNTMTPGTASHAMKTYRAVLRAAWYDDLLSKEPLKKPIRYPKKVRPKLTVWGTDEVVEVIQRLEGDSLYPLFLCMAGGGLRREEGYPLNWQDINFEQLVIEDCARRLARIKIFTAETEVDGNKDTKNDESYRIVTLPPMFAEPLYKSREDIGPIVVSRQGGRMSLSQLPKHWKGLFSEGKPLESIPFIPISRLRHTNSTMMQEAGVPDSVIAAFHGHRDVNTDHRHYLAPTSATIDSAAFQLERHISERLARTGAVPKSA